MRLDALLVLLPPLPRGLFKWECSGFQQETRSAVRWTGSAVNKTIFGPKTAIASCDSRLCSLSHPCMYLHRSRFDSVGTAELTAPGLKCPCWQQPCDNVKQKYPSYGCHCALALCGLTRSRAAVAGHEFSAGSAAGRPLLLLRENLLPHRSMEDFRASTPSQMPAAATAATAACEVSGVERQR